jgi:hypothetical protein
MRCCAGDGGAGVIGLVVLRGRCAGGGRKPPRAAAVKSRGGERRGKSRAVSAAGVSQEGERKRTTDDVSKDKGDVETGDALESRDEVWGVPVDCPDGVRRGGGASLVQALAWNVGTCRPDRATRPVAQSWSAVGRAWEIPKQRELRGAEYRCGAQGRTVS